MNAIPALTRPAFASETDTLIAVWVTRLCLRYPTALHYLNEGTYADELRTLLGIKPTTGRCSLPELRALLQHRHADFSAQPHKVISLQRNAALLGTAFALSPLQVELLVFAALNTQHEVFTELVSEIRSSSLMDVMRLVAVALNVSPRAIIAACQSQGPLLANQMLCFQATGYRRRIEVDMPNTLRQAMFSLSRKLDDLMRHFVESAPKTTLSRSDFAHLTTETEVLTDLLRGVLEQRTPGINILLYGSPGTGKTEFVRWLAKSLKVPLYQVRASNDQGEALAGSDRLSMFQLSQRFLQHTSGLLLFDEMEDVFPSPSPLAGLLAERPARAGKLFINTLLETNPVPALWVANTVLHIDPAYLRRFDYAFEMKVPPRSVRQRMLQRHLQGLSVSSALLERLSRRQELAPAQIEKAARVLRLSGNPSTAPDDLLEHLLDQSSALLGHDDSATLETPTANHYQLAYLNLDCDVDALLAGLRRQTTLHGAICFSGPPGTGKTALAHYLADELEVPLLLRRASDILGSLVGETEQRIAQVFREAAAENAILLLDEADSFLRERRGAFQSWEVTAVNEMLTQMERFSGLFICSTNLMESLDAAALRRFTFKIKFDYLRPEQRLALYRAHVSKLTRAQQEAASTALDRLTNLTPGDFAVVRRQAQWLQRTLTPEEWLERLRQESRGKADSGRQPIGFVSQR